MMARRVSEAEYYREHDQAFRLALETGCTPAEATRMLRRRKLADDRRRFHERKAALDAVMRCELRESHRTADSVDTSDPQPWMMRD